MYLPRVPSSCRGEQVPPRVSWPLSPMVTRVIQPRIRAERRLPVSGYHGSADCQCGPGRPAALNRMESAVVSPVSRVQLRSGTSRRLRPQLTNPLPRPVSTGSCSAAPQGTSGWRFRTSETTHHCPRPEPQQPVPDADAHQLAALHRCHFALPAQSRALGGRARQHRDSRGACRSGCSHSGNQALPRPTPPPRNWSGPKRQFGPSHTEVRVGPSSWSLPACSVRWDSPGPPTTNWIYSARRRSS